LQDDCIFEEVHSEQEEGWRLDRAAIAMQTNPLSAQREHDSITSPSNRITATTRARRCAYSNDRCRGIISHLAQTDANKEDGTVPLIDNLEITEIFEDEGEEEEASVTDLINQVSQLLRAELKELVDVAWAIIEPIKPCDEEW